jgi:cell division protein FtsI/penicillin-binding protein 2
MNVKNWRINLILFFILVAGGIVLSRLFNLQIKQGNYYRAIARGQAMSIIDIQGDRGAIYFANGEPLALTEKEARVFISPDEISPNNKEKVAKELASLLNFSEKDILEKANTPNSKYQVIKTGISDEQIKNITDLRLEGVYIEYQPKRSYPNNELASQVSGYLNKDGVGQYGLEGYYDDQLKGKSVTIKDNSPFNFFSNDDINGSSLYLTIDYNIQYMAEKLLDEGIEKYQAEGGQIIVMEPNTGAVIAMAQSPRYDPNNYQKEKDYSIFQNEAIEKIFEPGSIFKAITMSAAINENVVTPETIYDDKTGYRAYGAYKIYNYNQHAWGKITMTNALEHSVNTGLIFAEEQLGHQKFYNYLENFGFFEKTGIDLSGEVASPNLQIKQVLEKNNPKNTTFPNISFGQGIGITPLHIVRAYCAIANGGNLVKPYIVKEIKNENKTEEIKPSIIRRVLNIETSNTLKTMLISVIENGYGRLAKIPGYYIAGKTGTSQVPWTSLGENKSGYSPKTWQTFLGFAPAYNPKFVILVKLDNPVAAKTSEYSATPIFHDLAKYILDYWQIPPDYIVETSSSTNSLDKK